MKILGPDPNDRAELHRLREDVARYENARRILVSEIDRLRAKCTELEERLKAPASEPDESGRTGVYRYCGYVGTAAGHVVRDGTFWVATFTREIDAVRFVDWRNAVQRPASESPSGVFPVATLKIREQLEDWTVDYYGNLPDGDYQLFLAHDIRSRDMQERRDGEAPAAPVVPYPDFCIHPQKCAGRTRCPRRPSCCE
jgi:hypothetical protein